MLKIENIVIAAQFLQYINNGKQDERVKRYPCSLPCKDFKLLADVYEPPVSPKGVILFVHGMTPYGYRDPRMMALGRAAAMCRYRAIIPDYPDIKRGLIDAASVKQIIETVQLVTDDEQLCHEGKLSIFTASFSGVVCLSAICRPEINTRIKSAMFIGGGFNPLQCFYEIITEPEMDPYAKLILLKNIAREEIEADPVIEQGIGCAIEDAYQMTTTGSSRSNSLNTYLDNLSAEKRQAIMNLIKPIMTSSVVPAKYEPTLQRLNKEFVNGMDLENIRCRISLAHGSKDMVVLASESQAIYQQLRKHHIPVKLCITPLLGHSGAELKPQYVFSLFKLLICFGAFF